MNDLFDRLEEFKNDYNKVPKKMIIHISWHEDEKGKGTLNISQLPELYRGLYSKETFEMLVASVPNTEQCKAIERGH